MDFMLCIVCHEINEVLCLLADIASKWCLCCILVNLNILLVFVNLKVIQGDINRLVVIEPLVCIKFLWGNKLRRKESIEF